MTEKPSPLTTSVQLSSGTQTEYFLTFENPDGSFLVFPLNKDVVTIGRSSDCDITIGDPGISGTHAEFRRGSRGHYEVIDHQSSNGTRVNGLATQRAILRGGERIEFGPIECNMECREPTPEVKVLETPANPELEATRRKLAEAEEQLAELKLLSASREKLQDELAQMSAELTLAKSKHDRTLAELQALGPLMEEAKKSKADLQTTQARLDQARKQLEDILTDTGQARLVLNDLEQQCAFKKEQERELDRQILEKQGALNAVQAQLEGAQPGTGVPAAGVLQEKAS